MARRTTARLAGHLRPSAIGQSLRGWASTLPSVAQRVAERRGDLGDVSAIYTYYSPTTIRTAVGAVSLGGMRSWVDGWYNKSRPVPDKADTNESGETKIAMRSQSAAQPLSSGGSYTGGGGGGGGGVYTEPDGNAIYLVGALLALYAFSRR